MKIKIFILSFLFLANIVFAQQQAADIRDVKTIMGVSVRVVQVVAIGAFILLGLAAVIAAILFFVLTRKNKVVIPPKTLWETAMESLWTLEKKNYPAQAMYEQFYSELSDILRQYMEGRLGISAPEMTTEEFLNSPKTQQVLVGVQLKALHDFLTYCDMVKFAQFSSNVIDAKKSLELVRNLIGGTKPQEVMDDTNIGEK